MKNKNVQPPLTEHQKLDSFIVQLEFLLHPQLFDGFKKQLYACYEENKRDAYAAAKISDNALWIESELLKIKNHHMAKGSPEIKRFLIKVLYKQLLTKLEVCEPLEDHSDDEEESETLYQQSYLH